MYTSTPWATRFAPPTLSTKEQIILEINSKRSYASISKSKPAVLAVRVNMSYEGWELEDVPIPGKAVFFQEGDCLHIREAFDEDWWIGRLVTEGAEFGFVPSLSKLEHVRLIRNQKKERRRRVASEFSAKCAGKAKRLDHSEVGPSYMVIPLMRPILLVGPSLKGYPVTDLMQKALIHFLLEQFTERITVTRVNSNLSLRRGSMEEPTEGDLVEAERIFELGRKPQFVLLDCNNVNYPSQITESCLNPILAYIRINSQNVLQKLIKWRGKAQAKCLEEQIIAAETLARFPEEKFDIILGEAEFEDAGRHIVQYLETYWKSIYSVGPASSMMRRRGGIIPDSSRNFPNYSSFRRRSLPRDEYWSAYTDSEVQVAKTKGKKRLLLAHHFFLGLLITSAALYMIFVIYLFVRAEPANNVNYN